jgi:hypothetical protein
MSDVVGNAISEYNDKTLSIKYSDLPIAGMFYTAPAMTPLFAYFPRSQLTELVISFHQVSGGEVDGT